MLSKKPRAKNSTPVIDLETPKFKTPLKYENPHSISSLKRMTHLSPFGTFAASHHSGAVPGRIFPTSCGILPPSKKTASPLFMMKVLPGPDRSFLKGLRVLLPTVNSMSAPRATDMVKKIFGMSQ